MMAPPKARIEALSATKPIRPLLKATAISPVRTGHSPYVSGARPQRPSRRMLMTLEAPVR